MKKNILKLLSFAILFNGCGSGIGQSGGVSTGGGGTAPVVVGKKIFISAATFNGDLVTAGVGANGIVAADNLCQAEAAGNGITTAKALIVDSTNRIACSFSYCSATANAEHVDWILEANTLYTRLDGTQIGTTDSTKLFDFSLNDLSNSFGSAAGWAWTGLANDWTNSPDNCTAWTVGNNGVNGRQGDGSSKLDVAIDGGAAGCANTAHLYCVEQ